jgi:hypothetical protein
MRTKTIRKKEAPDKLSLYEALSALNQGFEQVLRELDLLRRSPLFRGNQFIKSCHLAVQEARALRIETTLMRLSGELPAETETSTPRSR